MLADGHLKQMQSVLEFDNNFNSGRPTFGKPNNNQRQMISENLVDIRLLI